MKLLKAFIVAQIFLSVTFSAITKDEEFNKIFGDQPAEKNKQLVVGDESEQDTKAPHDRFVDKKPLWLRDKHLPKEDGILFASGRKSIDNDGGFELGKKSAHYSLYDDLSSDLVSKYRKKYARGFSSEYVERFVLPNIKVADSAIRQDKRRYYLMLSIDSKAVARSIKDTVINTFERFEHFINNPNDCLEHTLVCLSDSYKVLNFDKKKFKKNKELLVKVTGGNVNPNLALNNEEVNKKKSYASQILKKIRKDIPILIFATQSSNKDFQSRYSNLDIKLSNRIADIFINNDFDKARPVDDYSFDNNSIDPNTVYVDFDYYYRLQYAIWAWVLRVDYHIKVYIGDQFFFIDDYMTEGVHGFDLNGPNRIVKRMTEEVFRFAEESLQNLSNNLQVADADEINVEPTQSENSSQKRKITSNSNMVYVKESPRVVYNTRLVYLEPPRTIAPIYFRGNYFYPKFLPRRGPVYIDNKPPRYVRDGRIYRRSGYYYPRYTRGYYSRPIYRKRTKSLKQSVRTARTRKEGRTKSLKQSVRTARTRKEGRTKSLKQSVRTARTRKEGRTRAFAKASSKAFAQQRQEKKGVR